MPPDNRNDQQDGFGDGGPRILLRAPTHATGDKGSVTSLHPLDSEKSGPAKMPSSEQDLESSSAYCSGSNPHDDSGFSPTTSRSASPPGSPARKREEDLAGLAPKHGVRFETDDRDVTARNSTEEDENDALKDVRPSSNHRTLQPTTAGILSIRVPELTDIRDAASDYQPPPSEADVTDRGERAFKDRKGEILSPVGSAESDAEVQDSLEDRLDEAMVYRFNRREGFMPRGKLEKLINVRVVEKELASITPLVPNSRTTKSWAELICSDPSSVRAICSVKSDADAGTSAGRAYRKIFAMLVRMDKVYSIFKFIEEEVSDEELPLMQYIPPEETQGNSIQLRRKNDATRPLKCFDGWKDKSVRHFFRDQWEMVSPFFAQGEHCNVRHYQLADADILPFTYDSHDEQGSNGQGLLERGGFGEVFKVQIHPDHHKFEGKHGFGNHKNQFFAVKKLFSTNEAEWKSEIEILKKFSANPNIHLISLLATYEQSGHVHLFFPWADADLQTFWKSIKSTPTPGLKTARWVARQCLGIASGIVAIHKHLSNKTQSSRTGEGNGAEEVKKDSLYGRHGDIKPRNILWFKDGPDEDDMGTLVITDFGIAELNSKNSRSNKPNRYIKFSPTYCAPEAHVPGGEICRSYDIWTLGCLYLEFVTWLLGGWKLVLQFARVRQTPEKGSPRDEAKLDRFFELEIDGNKVIGANVKLEVTEFIKRLRSHPGCTLFILDFLTLIEKKLLIIETSTTSRITSMQLHAVLFGMVGKMRSDESYGTNPVPEGMYESGVPEKTEEEHMPETTAENLGPETTWDNHVLEATWNNPAPEATGNDDEPNADPCDGTNDQNQAAISPLAVQSAPNPDNRMTV